MKWAWPEGPSSPRMVVDTSGRAGGRVSPEGVGGRVWRRAPSPPVGSGAVCKNEDRGSSESFISLGIGEKCLKMTEIFTVYP